MDGSKDCELTKYHRYRKFSAQLFTRVMACDGPDHAWDSQYWCVVLSWTGICLPIWLWWVPCMWLGIPWVRLLRINKITLELRGSDLCRELLWALLALISPPLPTYLSGSDDDLTSSKGCLKYRVGAMPGGGRQKGGLQIVSQHYAPGRNLDGALRDACISATP